MYVHEGTIMGIGKDLEEELEMLLLLFAMNRFVVKSFNVPDVDVMSQR